jgi:hypothetical protein
MKKVIHRRDFIRSATLAGAGVLVAKPLSPLPVFPWFAQRKSSCWRGGYK